MTSPTSVISITVPIEVKKEATNLFNSLGLNTSTSINMFLKRAIYERGIPFEINQPSQESLESLKELEDMENGRVEFKKYYNAKEMLDEILNKD